MDTYAEKLSSQGFNFENSVRNAQLCSEGKFDKTSIKTGTTIVGIQFNGGVILAADTRATSGLISSKNIEKIHSLSNKIACCFAGTAADCYYVTS